MTDLPAIVRARREVDPRRMIGLNQGLVLSAGGLA